MGLKNISYHFPLIKYNFFVLQILMRFRSFKYCYILSILVFLSLIIFSSSNFSQLPEILNVNIDRNEIKEEKSDFYDKILRDSADPNGKPLLVHQYANVSNTYTDVISSDNVSFNLAPRWTSQNVNISFDGLSKEKDWVSNGGFTGSNSGWYYEENDTNNVFSGSYDGTGDKDGGGCVLITMLKLTVAKKGNFAYYNQSFKIPEEFSSRNAAISVDLFYESSRHLDASIYMALIANGIEINETLLISDEINGYWNPLSLEFNPITTFGQKALGNVTVKIGVNVEADSSFNPPNSKDAILKMDNAKLELWTEPNAEELIRTFDNDKVKNYTYTNITSGKGYTFKVVERNNTGTEPRSVDFTIFNNMSDASDLIIDTVTVKSFLVKTFNSTVSSKPGSYYTSGDDILWNVEFTIYIPPNYESWVELEKPTDWNITSVIDGYQTERRSQCIGPDFGSILMKIPNSILLGGLYVIEAISVNYLLDGNIAAWNGTIFQETSNLTHGDKFLINMTLNNTITLSNTLVNFTIYYPNNTLLLDDSKQPKSFNVKYGNLTVGKNMSVGKYQVIISWSNNQSYLNRDEAGFIELSFIVWHQTNLTAITDYFELLAGDPLLLKVQYTDYDFNVSITFANVKFNSSYGISGTMSYQGSGQYLADIDTYSLGLGDYYFSFNASLTYYENKTAKDLIHLKIIAQPLSIKVPTEALNVTGNSYAICQVNLTGALTGKLIDETANMTTNWHKYYNITNHYNGTFTLNFSTYNLPTDGLLKSYTITIYANKTNYGTTQNSISLLVYPIDSTAKSNATTINTYINEIIDIKVNYSSSGTLIEGASCSITWSGSSNVKPSADGFIVSLNTVNLKNDIYTVIIKLSKPAYQNAYLNVIVAIYTQDVNLSLTINSEDLPENEVFEYYFNQQLNFSLRSFGEKDQEYISLGNVTWISEKLERNFTEAPQTYYNLSLLIDAAYFDPGINQIFIQFRKENYTTTTFSFQLFLTLQPVNLSVYINYDEITEDTLIEMYFKESLSISSRAFATNENQYLTGGNITWHSDNFIENLTESPNTCFNLTFELGNDQFNSGINYVYLEFEQNNYTTTTFSFQLLLHEQEIDISLKIDDEKVKQNELIETSYNEVITLTTRAYASIEKNYLTGQFYFVNDVDRARLDKSEDDNWYELPITISTVNFSLGINYVYIEFQKTDYSTTRFSFQIQVDQIDISVNTLSFEDSIQAYVGDSVNISIQLLDNRKNYIKGANITYSWEYGLGQFKDLGNGTYNLGLDLPNNVDGNHKFTLIISKAGKIYKTKEYPIIITISQRELPDYWIWIFIIGTVGLTGSLGVLSFKAYVLKPRALLKELTLKAKTQNYKDMRNIQAIILLEKKSGLPLYYRTYSFLKDTDPELFSGFVQAIIAIGTKLMEKETEVKPTTEQNDISKLMMEIDFKYFYALIYDYKELRVVTILKEKSSERLKEKIKEIAEIIKSEMKEELENFKGILIPFKKKIPEILGSNLDLHYKDFFTLIDPETRLRKTKLFYELTSLDTRVLNTLESYLRSHEKFNLEIIFDLIAEKNEDFVIEALESLLEKEFIIPFTKKN